MDKVAYLDPQMTESQAMPDNRCEHFDPRNKILSVLFYFQFFQVFDLDQVTKTWPVSSNYCHTCTSMEIF